MFHFSKTFIEFVEGTKIEQRGRSVQIEMQGVAYEDTWSEIRQRINLALTEASAKSTHIRSEIQNLTPNQNHLSTSAANEIYGERSFYILMHEAH